VFNSKLNGRKLGFNIPLTANICFEIENLRICSSAEAEIVLKLFLNLNQKGAFFLIKIL